MIMLITPGSDIAFVLWILLGILLPESISGQSPELPDIYSGCGVSKGCIGSTPTCVGDRNCPLVMSYRDDTKVFTFELLSNIKNGQGYHAVGFSSDKSMGKDLVIECVKLKSGETGVYQSYNKDRMTNIRINDTECKGKKYNKGIMNCTVIVVDIQLYCKFEREQSVSFLDVNYDLVTNRVYLIVVSGEEVSASKIGIHSIAFTSDHPIEFSKYDKATLPSTIGMKRAAHGVLMVICFIVFVPNGIFTSRYFKETFTSIIILERKLWFSVHVTIMSVGYLLLLIAIMLILTTQEQTNKGWPDIPSVKSHAQWGGAIIICFTIQMVFGWYRPVGRKGYKIYSMVHSTFGTLSYILALRNIGLSFYMGMPCEIQWLTVGAVLWLLIWHLVMTGHFYWLDSNLGLKKCRALRPWPIRMVLFDDAPGSKQRIRIAAIHFIGSVIFAFVMILEYIFKHKTCQCKENYCRKSS